MIAKAKKIKDEKSRKVGPPVIAIAISPVIAIANAKNCKDGTSSGRRNDGCTGGNEAKGCFKICQTGQWFPETKRMD